MLCENCRRNKAILAVKEILLGQEKNAFYCESCAVEKGFSDILYGRHFHLDSLITSLLEQRSPSIEEWKDKACSCGFTFDEFMKKGNLGCPQCYTTFKPVITSLFDQLFGTHEHIGKIPSRMKRNIQLMKQLEHYNIELDEMLKTENYERAAYLRDRIKELKLGLDTVD